MNSLFVRDISRGLSPVLFLCRHFTVGGQVFSKTTPPWQMNSHTFSTSIGNQVEFGLPKLTPHHVTTVLSMLESSSEVRQQSVKYFETNMLASNSPTEDRRAQARCLRTSGHLFGVFDGHGGCACSQAVSERLFNYIAVALLNQNELARYHERIRDGKELDLLSLYSTSNDYQNESLSGLYRGSLHKFVTESLSLSNLDDEFSMDRTLEEAFVRLDEDISSEALPGGTGSPLSIESLEVAFSGSVACVAHVDGPHLHMANVGDSKAVLGSLNEDTGSWSAKELTYEHNTNNVEEVKRIRDGHPRNETSFVLKNERLLGQLAPLRAFGDVRYKWKLSDLKRVIKAIDTPFARELVPPNYYTPPYLIAKPEVTYHRLTPRDKFMVLGSDGLWDMLTPEKVVKLVGEHMAGKQTIDSFKLPRKALSLGQINHHLIKRKEGLAKKPVDANVATHLIRNALGGTVDGIEHGKLSAMLTFPEDIVRYYRDDITVTVVFFDSSYLRTCPA
ncbi:pyruvate dehydrogenase [acetyl-transferring]-phosphatase 1, mitochondrial-like [Lineus longissimus]|uniref:pyruvate dehydrogenase [acetyl-transferring]-phosphatase 1, mitochondrial-like n=1 Tax=Lineus longissimus TaxID=88925 RepID=UPI002B4C7318